MRAVVTVMLKEGVLDPQGRAVAKALRRLETQNVDDVRIGKHIELTLSGERAEVEAQLAELIGRRHIVPVRFQPNPAVHVPTNDDDRPARPQCRRLEGGEIGGRVDQEGDPMRAPQPPAGLAFDEQPILPGTRSRSRAFLGDGLEKICLCHGSHTGIGAP